MTDEIGVNGVVPGGFCTILTLITFIVILFRFIQVFKTFNNIDELFIYYFVSLSISPFVCFILYFLYQCFSTISYIYGSSLTSFLLSISAFWLARISMHTFLIMRNYYCLKGSSERMSLKKVSIFGSILIGAIVIILLIVIILVVTVPIYRQNSFSSYPTGLSSIVASIPVILLHILDFIACFAIYNNLHGSIYRLKKQMLEELPDNHLLEEFNRSASVFITLQKHEYFGFLMCFQSLFLLLAQILLSIFPVKLCWIALSFNIDSFLNILYIFAIYVNNDYIYQYLCYCYAHRVYLKYITPQEEVRSIPLLTTFQTSVSKVLNLVRKRSTHINTTVTVTKEDNTNKVTLKKIEINKKEQCKYQEKEPNTPEIEIIEVKDNIIQLSHINVKCNTKTINLSVVTNDNSGTGSLVFLADWNSSVLRTSTNVLDAMLFPNVFHRSPEIGDPTYDYKLQIPLPANSVHDTDVRTKYLSNLRKLVQFQKKPKKTEKNNIESFLKFLFKNDSKSDDEIIDDIGIFRRRRKRFPNTLFLNTDSNSEPLPSSNRVQNQNIEFKEIETLAQNSNPMDDHNKFFSLSTSYPSLSGGSMTPSQMDSFAKEIKQKEFNFYLKSERSYNNDENIVYLDETITPACESKFGISAEKKGDELYYGIGYHRYEVRSMINKQKMNDNEVKKKWNQRRIKKQGSEQIESLRKDIMKCRDKNDVYSFTPMPKSISTPKYMLVLAPDISPLIKQ